MMMDQQWGMEGGLAKKHHQTAEHASLHEQHDEHHERHHGEPERRKAAW